MNTSYIKECYELYLKTFPDNWIDSVNSDSEIKALFDKFDKFIEQSFILFSKSAISGEYIQITDFEEFISNFIQSASFEGDPSINTNQNKSRIVKKFYDLNSSLYNALRHYQVLIEFAKNKLDTSSYERKYSSFSTKDDIDDLLNQFILYTAELCKSDYQLPTNKKDFYSILHIYTQLKELISKSNKDLREIYSILLQKCNFIIKRIETESFDYSLDSVIETINPSTLEAGELNPFLENTLFNDLNELEYINRIKDGKAQLRDYVFLMRFYKNELINKEDSNKMDFVIEYFEKYFKSERRKESYLNPRYLKEKYNRFALDSVYNFIYNCRFSFLCKHGNLTLKEIKSYLREIENIQKKTGVSNFHPYEKAIEAIINCTDKHLKTNIFEESLIRDKLDEIDRLINEYVTSLKWSKLHKFFPFQLCFEESICNSEVDNLQIFIPSANAKVINYKEQEDNLINFKQKRELFDFHLDLAQERREIENHKKTIEKIQRDINKSEKRLYELLGLFVAVITFLFGTINIFTTSNTSLSQLLVNTSGLGIVLLLFLSIFISTSPLFVERDLNYLIYLKSKRFIISAFSVLCYILIIVYFSFDLNKKQNNFIKEIETNSPQKLIENSDTLKSSKLDSIVIKPSNEKRKKIRGSTN